MAGLNLLYRGVSDKIGTRGLQRRDGYLTVNFRGMAETLPTLAGFVFFNKNAQDGDVLGIF